MDTTGRTIFIPKVNVVENVKEKYQNYDNILIWGVFEIVAAARMLAEISNLYDHRYTP